MARSFNGSSDFGRYSGSFASVFPLTMACLFQSSSTTALQGLMGVYTAAADTNRIWLAADGATGDSVNAVTRAGGSQTSLRTSTSYSADVWTHACGVWASATDRAAYLNAGGKVTSATSIDPSGMDRISVGAVDSATQGQFFVGNLAELGWWNAALTDAEVLALARGISPLKIRPGNLVRYEPFCGKGTTEREMIGGAELTLTGTGAAAHPRILRERPRNRWRAAVAGGGFLPAWARQRSAVIGAGMR